MFASPSAWAGGTPASAMAAVSDMNKAGWCDLHMGMGVGAKALAVEARRMRAADTFMVGYWCR